MMRRGLAVVVGVFFALAFAALPPAASLYDQVVPKVLKAKAVLEKDPAEALVLVEDAQKAFARGKDQLPPVIAAGIEQALKDARISVARKSKADLEGRLWVVRGAFAKALYDAFFDAVAKGDLEAAKPLLDRLIEASARPPSLKEKAWALAQKGDIAGLRRLFEEAYLQAIDRTLELAGDGKNRVHAYALTSKAYGLFLIIQDSPRVQGIRPRDFVDALAALTKGDLESYQAKIQEIRQKVARSLASLQKEAPPPTQTTPPVKETPAPAQTEAPKAAATTAPKATPPAPPPTATAPAPTAVAAPPVPRPPVREDVDTFRPPDWLPKEKKELVRARADALGYLYLADFLDTVEAVRSDIGAASALLGSAQVTEARRLLDRAWWRYTTRVEPVMSAAVGPMAIKMGTLLERLRRVPGVRTTDLTTMYNLIGGLKEHFLKGGHSPTTRIWLKTQAVLLGFTGLPRTVFFLLAGALAIFPLYLMRLTFGGRNIYWRLLGYAFFFLLLPAIIEAITYLADILANYGGLPQLAVLINLSVLQSLPAQIGWGISIFLVVVLAGWGLRGIAQQFGLLAQRRGAEPTVTATQELSPTATSESVIEWDEEF